MQRVPMRRGDSRPLTAGERSALSPGLASALDRAGVQPCIVARATIAARIARLWRGSTPIMARGSTIYWPGAAVDFSIGLPAGSMAILQHELQHVLEYATGVLSATGYILNPRNWTYRYRLDEGAAWSQFGAEQRAQIVEDYWRLTHARRPADQHRRVIPWAPKPSP